MCNWHSNTSVHTDFLVRPKTQRIGGGNWFLFPPLHELTMVLDTSLCHYTVWVMIFSSQNTSVGLGGAPRFLYVWSLRTLSSSKFVPRIQIWKKLQLLTHQIFRSVKLAVILKSSGLVFNSFSSIHLLYIVIWALLLCKQACLLSKDWEQSQNLV